MVIIKSFHEPLTIPEIDLWDLLFERKDRPFSEDKEIYIDPETKRSYTFAQARDAGAAFGRALRARWGFGRGDVLGFFSPNSIDFAPACFGALWAGGACSTANPTYTAEELAFQMRDSRAVGLVTQAPLLPVALAAARAAGIPEHRVVLIGDARDPAARFPYFADLRDDDGDASSSAAAAPPRPRVDPRKDVSLIVYSSGTTGLPKGVVLTHYNIVANLLQLAHVELLNGLYHSGGPDGQGDRQIAILPFFHVYGLTCIALQSIYMGISVVVLPRFDIDAFCAAIQAYGVSYASVPPPVVLALAKHPAVARYDLSGLKWINSGAAPLGRDLVDLVWKRLLVPVMQGYGLSETAPVLTKGTVAEWARYNGSCGRLVPNVEAKVVDPQSGRELAPGAGEGELWFRGPNVFPGYLNRPDLQPDTFSDDGFFKTGDIGYVDAKGNFYITDRLKELIKYKGFQVAPAELEGLLLGHPDVADACVVGVQDDERASEVPRAYVVLRAGVAPSDGRAADIAAWLADRVAPHKRLRGGVRFLDLVPKNASGKLLRRVLRDQARQEDARKDGAKL